MHDFFIRWKADPILRIVAVNIVVTLLFAAFLWYTASVSDFGRLPVIRVRPEAVLVLLLLTLLAGLSVDGRVEVAPVIFLFALYFLIAAVLIGAFKWGTVDFAFALLAAGMAATSVRAALHALRHNATSKEDTRVPQSSLIAASLPLGIGIVVGSIRLARRRSPTAA